MNRTRANNKRSDKVLKLSRHAATLLPLVAVCCCIGAALMCLSAGAHAVELPEGYLSEAESQKILDKTLFLTLDPDLSGLSPNEHEAIKKLIEVGKIFQKLYEQSRHHQAVNSREELLRLDASLGSPKATQNLLRLYYLFKGPLGRTLDNEYGPFLPVDPKVPGRNVYPWGVTKEEIESFLAKYPGSREWLLDLRSVVRRTERATVAADLAVLSEHPVLDVLHPGLKSTLESLASDPGDKTFYALPYSVAYAEPLTQAYDFLNQAAGVIEDDDVEFAGYLRNRARDLLSDDYESGDASWVTGRFKNLNAQIGSYEVYGDELYGVKSFFGMNILLRDKEQSDALAEAIAGLQSYENSLPYEPEGYDGTGDKKTVRSDIPVGVYNIVADFGQSRGTNTATILPNESEHARKYGRTILMRYNILKNPELFKVRHEAYAAAVAEKHVGDLTPDGGFFRTLWHEIGHYLGPDRTRDGRDLGVALESTSSTMEELKADLVSLFLVRTLLGEGYYTDEQARSVYADGVRRVLLKNKPQLTQPYQTMELMQFNYYLDQGLFDFDEASQRLVINHDSYHAVVSRMLEEVLALQYNGDKAAADRFVVAYTSWDEGLHGVLSQAMKDTERYRYAIVTYGILENEF